MCTVSTFVHSNMCTAGLTVMFYSYLCPALSCVEAHVLYTLRSELVNLMAYNVYVYLYLSL